VAERIYHRAAQAWAVCNSADPGDLTPGEREQREVAQRLDAVLADLVSEPIEQWRKGRISATELIGRILDAAGRP